ncbi:hypothetical protein ABZ990_19475 [Streptomyces sp. NPDC046203]|uniref:hypothetical protein n=1 Tax=Streptomyces sp. NPDC046203 TaxID=3154602 RepID=UPI0033C6FC95
MKKLLDSAIESAVSRRIGDPSGWNEGLLSTIEVLHVAHVRDLQGLSILPELRSLILVGCEIVTVSSLPFFEKLGSLEIEDSSLESLEGVGKFSLHTLGVRRNFLQEIGPVSGIENLEQLDVTGNPLSEETVRVILPELRARGVHVKSSGEMEIGLTRRLHAIGLPFSYYRSSMGYQLSRPGLALTANPEGDHPFVQPEELESLIARSPGEVAALFEDEGRLWPPQV